MAPPVGGGSEQIKMHPHHAACDKGVAAVLGFITRERGTALEDSLVHHKARVCNASVCAQLPSVIRHPRQRKIHLLFAVHSWCVSSRGDTTVSNDVLRKTHRSVRHAQNAAITTIGVANNQAVYVDM